MIDLEYKGIWWLPNNPQSSVSGILKYTPIKGAYLELIGKLGHNGEDEYTIILGQTANGKKITLYKCFITRENFSSNGFIINTIFCNIIFEEVHFNNEEDIKFSEISCYYSNIDEWAWMNGIEISHTSSNELDIKYKLPPTISAEINDDYIVEICPNTEIPPHSVVQKEVKLVQKIYVKVKNIKLNSFTEHRDILAHMQRFISLGIGEPTTQIEMIGKSEVNKEEFDGIFYYPDIMIYFYTKKETENYKQIMPVYMLFNLRRIQERFESYVKNWFNRKEVLNPIFDLYFGTLYNSDMYLEQRYLSLVQALESFHRRTRKNYELSPEEHETRVKSIIAVVNEQHKEWLKSRLEYSNEPTLRKRLKDILKEADLFVNLKSSKEREAFIGKMCNTRNYFTHYDASLVSKTYKGKELIAVCEKLKVIIQFYFLIEIGIETEDAREIIKQKYKYHNILE